MVDRTLGCLDGKVAVITGAASGIGSGIAERFAREGARLALIDLDADALHKLVARLSEAGATALSIKADVSVGEQVAAAMAQVASELGQLDILVNNAGIMIRKGFLDYTEQDWDRMMTVNLKSAFLCSQHAAHLMIKAGGGKIINIVSGAGMIGLARGAYGPSKAGLINLTASSGLELAPHNINVNAISPGATATPMLAAVTASAEMEEKVLRTVPMGRLGTPADVAGPAVFLASADSDYMVGSVLVADGGQMTTFAPY